MYRLQTATAAGESFPMRFCATVGTDCIWHTCVMMSESSLNTYVRRPVDVLLSSMHAKRSLSVHNRVLIAVYAAPPCVDGDCSCQRALVNFEAVQNRHPSTDRHKMSKFIIVREASRKSGANCVNPSKWRRILAK